MIVWKRREWTSHYFSFHNIQYTVVLIYFTSEPIKCKHLQAFFKEASQRNSHPARPATAFDEQQDTLHYLADILRQH